LKGKGITLIQHHNRHRPSGHTAYRPQAKPAPTNFDLWPNSHMQPRSAV